MKVDQVLPDDKRKNDFFGFYDSLTFRLGAGNSVLALAAAGVCCLKGNMAHGAGKIPGEGVKGPVFVALVTADGVQNKTFSQPEAEAAGLLHPQAFYLLDGRKRRAPGPGQRHCEVCGLSQTEFEQRGRFGCPACYQAFSPLVEPILKKVHRGTRHVGKTPRKCLVPEVVRNRLQHLEKQMAEAIRGERFEDAAGMRDEIQSLRPHLNS